jgi:tetratricopeptide (TPR) repeat protein
MAPASKQQCSVWGSVLSALLIGAPNTGMCQDRELETSEAPPEAKAHFERGREHFRGGRYREAIVDLEAALELDPDSPTLMYNLGYANELLGELEKSIEYYRSYIDALPPSATDEREKIRLTLRRLEGHRAQIETKPVPPEAPATRPPAAAAARQPQTADSFGRADVWFWSALGTGVALFGVAAAAGLIALDREDRVAEFVVGRDGSIGARQELQDEADRLALTSDLLIGGGGALVTAAALLYFLRAPDDERPRNPKVTRAALAIDGRQTLLVVGGRF